VLKALGERGIASLLVEGGSEVFTSFLRENAVDKLLIFISPKILGAGISAIGDLGIRSMDDTLAVFPTSRDWYPIGEDILFEGYLKIPHAESSVE
jgi:riboflavin biosynthesis pyrimidine reductase